MGEMIKIDEAGSLSGWMALPNSGSGRGVLVLHAWWGLTDFLKDFCDRLAGVGFSVLAPDLYHGAVAATIPEAEQLRDRMDGKQAKREIKAALKLLRAHPATIPGGLGVIGFSLGAYFACMIARAAPREVEAVVLFYGTGGGLYDKARARFQGHFAEHDPYEPTESVAKMEARLQKGGRQYEFFTYPGTGHWFFESDRQDAFDPAAALLAWQRTLDFLRR
jgi:carboxymethylenebutenolidase